MRDDRGLKRKAADGVWFARKRVPDDVRAAFDGQAEFVRSLKTTDSRVAEKRRDDAFREWDLQIGEARRRLVVDSTLPRLLQALDDWRRDRCAAAARTGAEPAWGAVDSLLSAVVPLSLLGSPGLGGSSDAGLHPDEPPPGYFERHPGASRELTMPHRVAILVGRLQQAARDPEAWRQIDNFDYALDAALAEAGAEPPHDAVRAELRLSFARAWLEVAQHEELQRLRAVVALAHPADLRIAPSGVSFVPREGDRTVAELIKSYRADRNATYGEESTARKYDHIFSALKAALGENKPVRAITREDARSVRELLRAIPSHMGKRFPGLSMLEAIEAAAEMEEEVPRLAPNTVNSYLSNLIAMLNWAMKEEWIEKNPASGLVDKNLPTVQRRGFTPSELETIFGALGTERRALHWRWWVCALGLYTGARLNELCQLRTADLHEEDGVPFLRVTVFDETGRRAQDKRIKTAPSQRVIPLHPELLRAGIVQLVRGQDHERLFPAIKPGPNGSYSHEPSKWFGSHLDRCGLKDPATVFHSFRHGFRDACDASGIDPEHRRALGGWAANSEAERYGNRHAVPLLAREVAKLRFGSFDLR